MWGYIWGGCLLTFPGVIVNFSFLITLWRGAGSGGTSVAGCCVIPIWCGGSGVSTLVICTGGGDGSCGTAMLKMAASCFSDAVCFPTSCEIGLDGAGFWRASVRSAAALVTTSDTKRLGNFFWTGKISVVSDTHSDAVLSTDDVSHIWCSIDGCTYHLSWPCGAHVPLLCGLLCTRVLVPGGGMVVLL